MAFTLMTRWGQGRICKSIIADDDQRAGVANWVDRFHANLLPLDMVLEVEGRNGETGEYDPLRLRVMDIRDIWIAD